MTGILSALIFFTYLLPGIVQSSGLTQTYLRAVRVRLNGNIHVPWMGDPQLSAGEKWQWIGVCFPHSNSNSITNNRIAKLLCNAVYGDGRPALLFSARKLNMTIDVGIDVSCRRNVTRIQECDFGRSCSDTSRMFGLACPHPSVADIRLRITGEGNEENTGFLQIRLGGIWGYVCDDKFTNKAARVACRNMNKPFSGAQKIISTSPVTLWFWMWLDDVTCKGTEGNLLQCPHRPVGENDCYKSEAVSIKCSESKPIDRNIPIRLRGGTSDYEGRVEIQIDGVWGTVCGDSFDFMDARVVCRSIGFPSQSARVSRETYYPRATGPVYIDDVTCYGNEYAFSQCRHRIVYGAPNCGHSADVGVICTDYTADTPQEKESPSSTPSAAIAITTVVVVVVLSFAITAAYLRRKRRIRAQHRRRPRSPGNSEHPGAVPSISQSVPGSSPPPSYSMYASIYLGYDDRNGVMNMGFQSGETPQVPDSAGAPPKYQDVFPWPSPSVDGDNESGNTPLSSPGDVALESGDTQSSSPGDGPSEGGDTQSSSPGDGPSESGDTQSSTPGDGPSESGNTQSSSPGDGPSESGDTQSSSPGDGPSESGDTQSSSPGDVALESGDVQSSSPGDGPSESGDTQSSSPGDVALESGDTQSSSPGDGPSESGDTQSAYPGNEVPESEDTSGASATSAVHGSLIVSHT